MDRGDFGNPEAVRIKQSVPHVSSPILSVMNGNN